MKLIKARFQNFRLLRDVELSFSTNRNRRLTVVRAANDSGKTTLHQALQWVLYGETALPEGGVNFRLYPVDWDVRRDGEHVEISGMLEFEKTYRHDAGDARPVTQRRYRLERFQTEAIAGSGSQRLSSGVKLFAQQRNGWVEIEEPGSTINDELPDELREVFFTDGDRTLGFIQADGDRSTRRKKVEDAIRSLLGLGVLDNAIRHIEYAGREVTRKAKSVGGDDDLGTVSSRLDELSVRCDDLEREIAEAKENCRRTDDRVARLQAKVDEALIRGNRQELQNELAEVREQVGTIDRRVAGESVKHSELFCGADVAVSLLVPVLEPALDVLGRMHDEGRIPSATVPVLRDRLDAGKCICGASLEVGDKVGEVRRSCIEALIEESKQGDEVRDIVTRLYYWCRMFAEEDGEGLLGAGAWEGRLRECVASRDELRVRRETMGRKRRRLEKEIEDLPDSDVPGLQRTLREYRRRRDEHLRKESELSTTLKVRRGESRDLELARDRLLKQREQGRQLLAEVDLVADVKQVFKAGRERMAGRELAKVSESMNRIFLEMIGADPDRGMADPDEGLIVRRAEINDSFDIIVLGPQGRRLNADRDLNGAARRALTLAFILALAGVSGVSAPSVIDTPLGMASGYVRRSILRLAIRKSQQLILLLTHDEIVGCEEIIDEFAGNVVTLTNPAHFPVMLVNGPPTRRGGVLVCGCDHRKTCEICERRSPRDEERTHG